MAIPVVVVVLGNDSVGSGSRHGDVGVGILCVVVLLVFIVAVVLVFMVFCAQHNCKISMESDFFGLRC